MLLTDLSEALLITINSMLIVFCVLLLLMGLVYLFKYIPNVDIGQKRAKAKKAHKYVPFEKMDDDMKVAALVATIEYKKQTNNDVRLKSIKRI